MGEFGDTVEERMQIAIDNGIVSPEDTTQLEEIKDQLFRNFGHKVSLAMLAKVARERQKKRTKILNNLST